MANSLEFYFDYISPFSYVANAAVAQLAERIGGLDEEGPPALHLALRVGL